MKKDRELLELAAKAAGMETQWEQPRGAKSGCLRARVPGQMAFPVWRPLDDDGEALRLAVTLGLIVEPGRAWISKLGPMFGEDVLPCPHAATRRAIVRAAAELGATNRA